jgi:hypothetical protein
MLFTGIANPEQLKILATALEEYCRASDIEPETQAYEDAARHIMALFNNGAVEIPAFLYNPFDREGTL